MTTALESAGHSAMRHGGRTWMPCRRPHQRSGPRVLVVFAGRHGSTREIAATLARSLSSSESGRRIGLSTVLAPAQQHPDPAAFDAVVLGSAVYGGRWLEPATSYLAAHAAVLSRRTTLSFSSGVWSPGSVPMLDAESSRSMHVSTSAREHRWFAGRLEHRLLSAAEREAVSGSGMQGGDHREWGAVREWAAEIAEALETAGVGSRRHEVA